MFYKKRCTVFNQRAQSVVCIFVLTFFVQIAIGQVAVPLNDLSAFKSPGKTWKIGGEASAGIDKESTLTLAPGTGVLANMPGAGGTDLYTNAEYGDIDVELEYMMTKGSNSGIYLQGRYEVQLADSWGVLNPTGGDNGAIYQRWDETRPAGQYGFEGRVPRQNASKAPGLWQKMRISFQAPRFDAAGKKIENAKFLHVELNGVVIHESAEMSGPTRGAMTTDEKPTGPLRIQGDHGPVAIRNLKIISFDKPRPEFTDISYTIYSGRFYDTLDLKKLPPEAKGTVGNLTATAIQNVPPEFFIRYTGKINIKEPGEYGFNLSVPGGRGIMRINNQALNQQGFRQRATISLPAGEFPFELLFTKNEDWTNRALSVAVQGPGIREYSIGDVISGGRTVDPILVDASVNKVLRSFMDLPGGIRVVHAASVGSPAKVHYTYDMDKGTIIQVWRGDFLDATPMWYSRGDGSSRPVGAVQRFGKPTFTLAKLSSADAPWVVDSAVTDFVTKGYKFDKNDVPTFMYTLGGTMVEDGTRVLNNGEGLSREITLKDNTETYYARIAEGSTIETVDKDLYVVDGKSYYIRIDDASGAKPITRDVNGNKLLLVPVQSKLRYSILF